MGHPLGPTSTVSCHLEPPLRHVEGEPGQVADHVDDDDGHQHGGVTTAPAFPVNPQGSHLANRKIVITMWTTAVLKDEQDQGDLCRSPGF